MKSIVNRNANPKTDKRKNRLARRGADALPKETFLKIVKVVSAVHNPSVHAHWCLHKHTSKKSRAYRALGQVCLLVRVYLMLPRSQQVTVFTLSKLNINNCNNCYQ